MSIMRAETLEIPAMVTRQLYENDTLLHQIALRIKTYSPDFALTVARGSSDHAATFVKYICETQLGILTSSAAPSVFTLYQALLKPARILAFALSQSGQSPDISEVLRVIRAQGGLTLALVNEANSPLAEYAEYVVPLHAGPEHAVAATKSYVAMLVAILHLTAVLKQDDSLLKALNALPRQLHQLKDLDFSSESASFLAAENALVIGRGFSFPIAQEAALKMKEVTQIHAESFSGAEVLHGPFSLFHQAFPVIVLLQQDATLSSNQALLNRILRTPVKPLLLGNAESLKGYRDCQHILLPDAPPLLTPILAIFVLYQFIEQLAIQKGLNPDTPPLIQKITKTL